MISAWTKHIKDPQEKENFQRYVLSSRDVLERLGQIMNEMKEDVESPKRTYTDYNNPNWAYKQADNNGWLRCLEQIQRVIDLDYKESKS